MSSLLTHIAPLVEAAYERICRAQNISEVDGQWKSNNIAKEVVVVTNFEFWLRTVCK